MRLKLNSKVWIFCKKFWKFNYVKVNNNNRYKADP